jgi:hypothetical protein
MFFAPSFEFLLYLLEFYGFLGQIKGFALVLKEFVLWKNNSFKIGLKYLLAAAYSWLME